MAEELADLRRRIVELEAREAGHTKGETALAQLASFPEQNPNPVIETDLQGAVTYLNPVARERFPDLEEAGLDHPILNGLESAIRTLREAAEDSLLRELQIGDYTYEQKTTFMAEYNLVRIFAYDITELKRMEASQSRLAAFPEQNPNPVIETDLHGAVTYLNPVARERFPDLEAAGLNHPILNGLESAIHTLRDAEEDSLLRELQIGDYTYEQKTTFMAEYNLVRIFAYDITELKRMEASQSRLAAFPEQNPNPVIETDLHGAVTYLNPVARERFPDLEAAGLNHPILNGLESAIHTLRDAEEDSLLRELQIGHYSYEQKTTFMAENDLVRIFAYDITERKQLQKQLEESLAELEQTNRDLKDTQVQLVQSEKMAAMANLVAGIAHEINTPIGAISSVHDTIKRAAERLRSILGEDHFKEHPSGQKADTILRVVAESADVIKTGSERVSSIVQSMKNFARLDEAELKRVDVHEGLKDALRLVQHDLGDRISVVEKYGDVEPIVCYPSRLNQVFLCLLVNAIEAVDGDGRIVVTTQKKDEKLWVSIEDNGSGIPEESLAQIFDPGFTTKGVGVGTGLGLSICHQIVQDHNGTIEVESEVGQGTTITTILPYSFSGFMLR